MFTLLAKEKFVKRLFILSVVVFYTATLFLILQIIFPPLTSESYALIENVSVNLFIALIISILLLKLSDELASIILGGASGAVFFLSILGIKIVVPTQIGWLIRGDWQWHFIGWHFFRRESWQMPLGEITGFFYPVSSSVGYTDSIPLLAFLFKPFHQFLPADFQYLGLWLLSCFVLQGVFGILLLRLITTNRFLQLIGAIFFVTSPILLNRIGHTALSAHWLLLAGLWLYFKPYQISSRPLTSWAILMGISALTHPYLTVMMLGLTVAFYGRWWLVERQCSFYSAISQLSLLGLLTLVLWWQAGYFLISGQQMVARELGHYSMNLLAFVNPLGWSVLLRDFPLATDGQYEGFGYLGAGLLLLSSWVIYELCVRPVTFLTIKRILPLVVIAMSMLIFAASSKVTLGTSILFEGHYEWLAILAPFQSSGRFLWLTYYFILFSIFKILITRHAMAKALFLLSFGLIVQLADLQNIHYHHRAQRLSTDWQTWDNPLKSPVWTIAAPYYQHLTFVPPIACGEPPAIYSQFSYFAASYGLTLNTGQAARFDAERTALYCQELFTRIQQGQIEDDTIYLIHPDYLVTFKQFTQKPLTCARIDGVHTCVTTESYLRWQGKFLEKTN